MRGRAIFTSNAKSIRALNIGGRHSSLSSMVQRKNYCVRKSRTSLVMDGHANISAFSTEFFGMLAWQTFCNRAFPKRCAMC
ncbi:hypothetical protein Y032_0345g3110 [Ancylostoma ceylanicum]|uniref:Uncharacterized protein n=1 Tax=Ancylostoma ceylanicum TaxID=53326 RepID=A0A016RY46_9BILA|nr:hypothetical protein Y032_0345g3110 [Ancylostoma ceylanicum]